MGQNSQLILGFNSIVVGDDRRNAPMEVLSNGDREQSSTNWEIVSDQRIIYKIFPNINYTAELCRIENNRDRIAGNTSRSTRKTPRSTASRVFFPEHHELCTRIFRTIQYEEPYPVRPGFDFILVRQTISGPERSSVQPKTTTGRISDLVSYRQTALSPVPTLTSQNYGIGSRATWNR